MVKKICVCMAMLLVAACSQSAADPQSGALDFKQGLPLRLDIATIRVEQHYQSPMTHPNVEQEFTTSPAQAVEQWTTDRLEAAGNNGVLVVNVDDASVVTAPLPKENAIRKVFSERQVPYNAKLSVTLRLYDGASTMAVAEAHVTVTRTRTLKEGANTVERAQFYTMLTHDLMVSYDTQATAQIRQYFSNYLRP